MLSPVDTILSFGGQIKLSAKDKEEDMHSNMQIKRPIPTAELDIGFRHVSLRAQGE
jgi:hypothetical protein